MFPDINKAAVGFSMQSAGSGAGGKAASGRHNRPGGGVGGTPSASRTPYARPQSGNERTPRASGLETSELPLVDPPYSNGDSKGGDPSPSDPAPVPARTPSTIGRFFTPIRAAGDYFFGSVSEQFPAVLQSVAFSYHRCILVVQLKCN